MNQALHTMVAGLVCGPTITLGNFSVTALLSGGMRDGGNGGTRASTPAGDAHAGKPDYLTLDEALAGGMARVTEVSQSGTVPQLRFVNDGDAPVLLLDGEELVGAKQNRILNLSIFVPAKCDLAVPVSCVEAGRWRYDSATFRSEGRAFYAEGRKQKMAQVSKSMREGNSRAADQHAVWDSISLKAARMGTKSETGAMADVFKDNEAHIERCVNAVTCEPGQVGAVFRIGGKVSGIELFDYPQTFAKLLPKLVRSYALDALDEERRSAANSAYGDDAVPDARTGSDEENARRAREQGQAQKAGTDAIADAAFRRFLDDVLNANVEAFPALGEGEDLRLEGEHVAGGALAARERVVHFSAFRLDEEDRVKPRASRWMRHRGVSAAE